MCDMLETIEQAIDYAEDSGMSIEISVKEGPFKTTVNIEYGITREHNNYCNPDEQEKQMTKILEMLRYAEHNRKVSIGYYVSYRKRNQEELERIGRLE